MAVILYEIDYIECLLYIYNMSDKYQKPSCIPTYNPYTGESTLFKNKHYVKYTGQSVYVYSRLNNSCSKSHRQYVVTYRMNVEDLLKKKKYNILLFYCKQCDRYFTHIAAIQNCLKNGRRPAIRYHIIPSFDLKQQSILNLYGYNVRQDDLSEDGRRKILKNVIDKQIMHRIDVINLLSHLINYNGRSERNIHAAEAWESDLRFVMRDTNDLCLSKKGILDNDQIYITNNAKDRSNR